MSYKNLIIMSFNQKTIDFVEYFSKDKLTDLNLYFISIHFDFKQSISKVFIG